MVSPMAQHVLHIERPPYYHPPRSRPVSFEQPDTHRVEEASCFLRQNLASQMDLQKQHQQQQLHHQQQHQRQAQTIKMFERVQQPTRQQEQQSINSAMLRNLPSHNTTPKPFAKSHHQAHHDNELRSMQPVDNYYYNNGGDAQEQQPMGPRVVLNDQSGPYPTSTVHKSMLRSRSPVIYRNNSNNRADGGAGNESGASYERLVSPPTYSLSLHQQTVAPHNRCPVNQRQVEMAQHLDGRTEVKGFACLDGSGDRRQAQGSEVSVGKSWPTSALNEGMAPACQARGAQIANYLNAQNEAITAPPATTATTTYKPPAAGFSKSQLAPAGGRGGPFPAAASAYASSGLPLISVSGAGTQAAHTKKKLSSNTVLPDSKRDEYMWNQQLERQSIAHQTYRTLPIVQPKPKARHDLAAGNYMRLSFDPTWDLAQSRPASASAREREHERKIQQAISGVGAQVTTTSQAPNLPTVPAVRGGGGGGGGYEEVPVFDYREYIKSTCRAYQ